MPARSETLIGGEELHLFYLFYQVEIRWRRSVAVAVPDRQPVDIRNS